MDAKYSGWNEKKKCYKLPGNMDIYKQFFYQEQMLRIYEQAGQKDVCVYNFLPGSYEGYRTAKSSQSQRLAAFLLHGKVKNAL